MAEIICKLCGAVNEVEGDRFQCEQCYTEQAVKDLQADVLRRGFAALREENWEQATAYAELVLANDDTCAGAYLLRLMAQRKREELYKLAWEHIHIKDCEDFRKAYAHTDGIPAMYLKNIVEQNEEQFRHIIDFEPPRRRRG